MEPSLSDFSCWTCGCGSKPMVPFWRRCTTHFSPFCCGLGCSLGVRAFDPWPCSRKETMLRMDDGRIIPDPFFTTQGIRCEERQKATQVFGGARAFFEMPWDMSCGNNTKGAIVQGGECQSMQTTLLDNQTIPFVCIPADKPHLLEDASRWKYVCSVRANHNSHPEELGCFEIAEPVERAVFVCLLRKLDKTTPPNLGKSCNFSWSPTLLLFQGV